MKIYIENSRDFKIKKIHCSQGWDISEVLTYFLHKLFCLDLFFRATSSFQLAAPDADRQEKPFYNF